MRQDLGIFHPNGDGPAFDWYVPANTLLQYVTDAVGSVGAGSAPKTNGLSARNAWVLKTHDDWVGAWQKLKSDATLINKEVFFAVGGRIIRKGSKAARQGDGFYMSDAALSGTDPNEGNIWSREDGASYREFGKFFQDSKPVAPMEQVTWSKQVADELRGVLLGTKNFGKNAATDVKTALPMLACAMFLAEPSRNAREWVVGKMMLDLIGEVYASANPTRGKPQRAYELDRTFAHPLRTDPKYKGSDPLKANEAQSGPNTDRYKKEKGVRTDMPQPLVSFGTKAELVRVEGKYPASPAKSGATSTSVDVAGDYIQKKEASITARWLARKLPSVLGEGSYWRFTALKVGQETGKINLATTTFPDSPSRQGCKEEWLQIIRDLLLERARSFAA